MIFTMPISVCIYHNLASYLNLTRPPPKKKNKEEEKIDCLHVHVYTV